MSGQNSIFLPSNGSAKFEDLFSATSAPNWSKVSNENGLNTDAQAKKLMSDINGMLSEVRKETGGQSGGAKKSKKAPAKGKSKSKSASSKKKAARPKTASKKSSKKNSSKKVKPAPVQKKASSKGKKMKRQSGGEDAKPKKGMNEKFKNMRELATIIKDEIPDLKDGPVMASTASKLLNKFGSLNEAISEVKKNKSSIKKLYNEVAKAQKENREKKKAEKQKSKEASTESQ